MAMTLTAPSIPEPAKDNQSLLQAVLAIKQNIEITQGTRMSVNLVAGQTAAQKGVNEAIYRFTHP